MSACVGACVGACVRVRVSTEAKMHMKAKACHWLLLQAPWEGDNLKHLRALLEGRTSAEVQSLLSNPARSAVSELEVGRCI